MNKTKYISIPMLWHPLKEVKEIILSAYYNTKLKIFEEELKAVFKKKQITFFESETYPNILHGSVFFYDDTDLVCTLTFLP